MDALRRYLRSPPAVIGLLLLLLILLMAASAGWLYPRDPLSLAGRPLVWPFDNPRFLLGTDNSGAPTIQGATSRRRFSTARASRC
jgi:peptide/nickel transport system permease protein